MNEDSENFLILVEHCSSIRIQTEFYIIFCMIIRILEAVEYVKCFYATNKYKKISMSLPFVNLLYLGLTFIV